MPETSSRSTSLKILPQNKVDYLVQYLLGTETITREIADEDYEYYFADADGAHVGFVAVAPKDDHLYLSKLYLTKGNRGKGYGRQELQFVKQRARAHGLDKIASTVHAKTSRASTATTIWASRRSRRSMPRWARVSR